jgi:DNA-binding beta-propeller fold protein YncE
MKSGHEQLPQEKLLMTNRSWIFALTSAFSFVSAVGVGQIDAQTHPLSLVQTIPLPGVHGRIDHMDVDTKGQRLFVAGLENGSLEVVDLRAGKSLRSIPGFKKPQGVAFVRALNKVFVASGDDGRVRVFRADTLALLDTISLDIGPNRVLYDSRKSVLYVGYGGKDAGKDYGEVGVIDAKKDKLIADIQVAAHPAELLLDESGRRLFCFVSPHSKIHVIDTKKRKVTATWPVSSERPGDGAFDPASNRLFIGTRKPPQMIVMNAATGREVLSLPTADGMDGVYFDAKHRRVYVSGGRDAETGAVSAYQQKDADHYELIDNLPTRQGAGTSLWVPELNRFYVGAPAHDAEEAAILVFEAQP